MKKKLVFSFITLVVVVLVMVIPTIPNRVVAEATTTIQVKKSSLEDHECNSTEWHFVINQIDEEAHAPASIHVVWSNASEEDVPLNNFTGGVARYTTYSNLDSTVVSATAVIYSAWEDGTGQFNLSHGPCGIQDPTPTSTPTSTSTGTSTPEDPDTPTPTGTSTPEDPKTPTPTEPSLGGTGPTRDETNIPLIFGAFSLVAIGIVVSLIFSKKFTKKT